MIHCDHCNISTRVFHRTELLRVLCQIAVWLKEGRLMFGIHLFLLNDFSFKLTALLFWQGTNAPFEQHSLGEWLIEGQGINTQRRRRGNIISCITMPPCGKAVLRLTSHSVLEAFLSLTRIRTYMQYKNETFSNQKRLLGRDAFLELRPPLKDIQWVLLSQKMPSMILKEIYKVWQNNSNDVIISVWVKK